MTIGERNRAVISSYGYTGNIQKSANALGISYNRCKEIIDEWKECGEAVFYDPTPWAQGENDKPRSYKAEYSSMREKMYDVASAYTDKVAKMKAIIEKGDKVYFFRDGQEMVGKVEKVFPHIVETKVGNYTVCPMYKDIFKVKKAGAINEV